MGTLFAEVYNCFLGKITDDMYMELTPEDTIKDLQNLLVNAIPLFEFPKQVLNYTISEKEIDENSTNVHGFVIGDCEDASVFKVELTSEEINILAILMQQNWLQRQVTSIENIRMMYGGTDFKMTSQANHLGKLMTLLEQVKTESHHLQRLYKRRRTDVNGQIRSNWSVFNPKAPIEVPKGEIEDNTIIFDGGVIKK